MFERFTDRARRVVVRAQVLTGLGADLDGARAQVTQVLARYQRERGSQAG